jgi:Putative beta-barrel porin 2
MHRRGWVGMAFVTALAVAPASRGSDFGYQVTVGAAETDNIFLTPTDHKSDTIINEGLDLTLREQSVRLTANVDADLQYLEFLNHTFNDQLIGNFLGDARFALVPEYFFWDLDDNFGQGRINPLAQVTPANQENINYANTGPEVMLPLGGETLLDLQAHYAKVTYEVSPLNSSRVSGQVGVLHKLSADSTISINVHDEHVNYSNDVLNEDYTRQDAFVRYDAKGARTTIAVDLGYSRLRDSASPNSGVLARLELSRKMSSSQTLAVVFSHQYSDAADSFRLGQTLGGANLNVQTGTQTGAPFTSDTANIAWNFLRQRTGFGAGVTYFKDAYEPPATLDNDNRVQVDAHASRQLTPNLQLALTELYLHEKFINTVGTFNESDTQLALTWRAGRRLSVALQYSHDNRHSDLPQTNYGANRIWLTVGYGRPAQVPPGPATPPLPTAARLY